MPQEAQSMSKLFGEIRQIAFVVPDIDEAMRYWSQTLGVGPFFVKRRITFSEYVFRGAKSESPIVSIALSNSGRIQIELIQQHDEKESIYREFLLSNRRGLQHVSSWQTRAGFDALRRKLLDQGYALLKNE
jgi:hypothetical protein